MIDTLLLQPQPISSEQRSDLWSVYSLVAGDPIDSEKLYQSWYEFFIAERNSEANRLLFQNDYWSWFVDLVWRDVNRCSQEQFMILFPLIAFEGMLLDYDVSSDLFSYVIANVPRDQWNEFGKGIHGQLFPGETASPPIRQQEKSLTFAEIAESYKKIKKEDSLQRAEYLSTVEKKIFGFELTYSVEKKNTIITEFFTIISFFYEKRSLEKATLAYGRKQVLGKEFYFGTKEILEPFLISEVKKIQDTILKQTTSKDFLSHLQTHKEQFSDWINQTASLVELLTWMKSFTSKEEARKHLVTELQQIFPDIGTDFSKASAIIEMDHFLQANGFGSDEDILFFEETTEQFTWNL